VTPIEHVLAEYRFSLFGNVSLEKPPPDSLAVQKAGVVAIFGRFLIERTEP